MRKQSGVRKKDNTEVLAELKERHHKEVAKAIILHRGVARVLQEEVVQEEEDKNNKRLLKKNLLTQIHTLSQ
jgi:hypothetical protein